MFKFEYILKFIFEFVYSERIAVWILYKFWLMFDTDRSEWITIRVNK